MTLDDLGMMGHKMDDELQYKMANLMSERSKITLETLLIAAKMDPFAFIKLKCGVDTDMFMLGMLFGIKYYARLQNSVCSKEEAEEEKKKGK